MAAVAEAPRVLNVNVGILGHVDSGKTSIARALSTVLSTAALDKHPQSAERGITLDLGFSAFNMPMPAHLAGLPYDQLQVTLVDCPGHASLIRTIIGGAQIIDLMLLVVDVCKGMQTQTAECLVVGEISPTKDMLVLLNKTDLLPAASKEAQIEKMKKRLRATLRSTKFATAPIVAVSAQPGGPEGQGAGTAAEGMDLVVKELVKRLGDFKRSTAGPFLFSVDHCFPIRGQGSVMTGTVLQGSVAVNQMLELPALKLQRKVKSMQMFHRPVTSASQGDRVAICVTQLDAKQLERGLAAEPGTVPSLSTALARVERIRYFKGRIPSKMKFHVTVGHTTCLAEAIFCKGDEAKGRETGPERLALGEAPAFDFTREYAYEEELLAEDEQQTAGTPGTEKADGERRPDAMSTRVHWALLTFDTQLTCPYGALLVASRLDADAHSNTCRLAFHGRLSTILDKDDSGAMQRIKVYKTKQREGTIERVVDSYTAIGKGLFKKETDISVFVGLKVHTADGAVGVIVSSFGKSGKYKISFVEAISSEDQLVKPGHNRVVLAFKRYIFDKSKRMVQS